jgi:hypothetical protein
MEQRPLVPLFFFRGSPMFVFCLLGWLLCTPAVGQTLSDLKNGSFETVSEAYQIADGLANGWKLSPEPRLPASWILNPAYPGELAVIETSAGQPAAHSGKRFVRISAAQRHAHLYQMCEGLDPAQWYRVTAWVRGGEVSLSFYEYFTSKKIGGQGVIQPTLGQGEWKRVEGLYRPTGGGYLRSALAIVVAPGHSVEVDDVAIERIAMPPAPADSYIVLETDGVRIALSSQGLVREFRSKASNEEYAVAGTPVSVLQAVYRGVTVPLHSLSREGDVIRAQFLDHDVRATLRVSARKHHIQFEVVDIQPAGVEELTFSLPVRRLATLGGAFNATYDKRFGICLLGVTENTNQQTVPHGADVVTLSASCTRKRGIVGARLALVASDRQQFELAIMETERENGLPCPMLEGKWARNSEPVRRSYLFLVDARESNIDRAIEYAKLGRFGMIMFLKDNWLATHGHFRINMDNFPEGVASLKRTVAKIHAAGMGAGVHVFGPSISPNDPFITPKPDHRLAFVSCPPLAKTVDDKETVILLDGEPDLPPRAPRSNAFPGYHIQIGDEIIRYQNIELGPAPRLVGCQRGALGTRAAPHGKGAEVKGLLTMWGYFLVDPASTLADEITTNFATVFNECNFDMVYFDASDGINDAYVDSSYYLNKMHLSYYRKFKKDILYQTSNGTGKNLVWHIVPRAASADGHGDLKKYLDERLPVMQAMASNFTRPDVGWYYMFDDVRPDQIEYVCAKALGMDSSISIETSLESMEKHARARQMIEMVGRYEQCRLGRFLPESVREAFREPGKDFKLFHESERGGSGWQIYRAAYEELRYVEFLDGKQNAWTIKNDQSVACPLGVEIAHGSRNVPTSDYNQAGSVTIESFDDGEAFRWDEDARAKHFFQGSEVTFTALCAVTKGVDASLTTSRQDVRVGNGCVNFSATNKGPRGGRCATARKFPHPVDLSRYEAIGFWVEGDAKGEILSLQLYDAVGRRALFEVPVNFAGWRLCVFRTSAAAGFDWSKPEYLLVGLRDLAGGTSVQVRLDDLRGLPNLRPASALINPAVQVNGRTLTMPVRLDSLQAVTIEDPGGVVRFWPGGMKPSQAVGASAGVLMLQPGENRILFSADAASAYPGDITVLLYRMWPLKRP